MDEGGSFVTPNDIIEGRQNLGSLGFFEGTYEAAAALSGWDRKAPERDRALGAHGLRSLKAMSALNRRINVNQRGALLTIVTC
jgi:hypothetical protein